MWQRILFFRPWYEDARVVEIACGTGAATGYSAIFAKSAIGYDEDLDAVEEAKRRHRHASFSHRDLTKVDVGQCDLILSLNGLERAKDPAALLDTWSKAKATVVVAASSDRVSTDGWTADRFVSRVESAFGNATITFLSQGECWPYSISEGMDEDASAFLAVIGDRALPKWPKIGLSMAVFDQVGAADQAIAGLTMHYPGELVFALVANGTPEPLRSTLRKIQESLPKSVQLIELPENVGFGQGVNTGLGWLRGQGGFDLYGTVNDDVLPAADCLPQLATAFRELAEGGYRPGILGPVSNQVNGTQRVNIGEYDDYESMLALATKYSLDHHSQATQVSQIRGLCMLISPDCLDALGGFDPAFGLGNFEDDDYNVRARLAGFSLWQIDGAFLHHVGSSTFRSLDLNYTKSIERNGEIFLSKWDAPTMEDAFLRADIPTGTSLFVPFDAPIPQSGHRAVIEGKVVDLVYEATDMEFAAWVHHVMSKRPRDERIGVLELMNRLTAEPSAEYENLAA